MPVPPDSRADSDEFDQRLLKQLACPACLGTLRLVSSVGQIVCVECKRAYPLIDGIPVLIVDRAMRQKPE
jgi:uncharacterized protein YbaR (Trm112 family)